MSEHGSTDIDIDDEPTPEQLAALDRLLGDATVWDEPDPGVEDLVVAAIVAEAASDDRAAGVVGAPVVPAGDVVDARHRFGRGWVAGLGAAAAVAFIVAVGWMALRSPDPEGELVALAPTELAPASASAEARVSDQPGGTRIILDVEGLPPPPDGSYYEAWLRQSPEIGVSAGTFHLRGGDDTVELWVGVSAEDYPLVTVTLQEEGAGAESSGRVVLRGEVGAG